MDLESLLGARPLAIAVVHLPNLRRVALERSVDKLLDYVERECGVLSEAGFDGVVVENFNDRPYPPRCGAPEVLGLISVALHRAVKCFPGFVGLNILRCSPIESYRIAYSFGAQFIRINTLVETIATDSGVIEPSAPSLAELRTLMPGVKVFADIVCKHSGSLDLALRAIAKMLETEDPRRALAEALREIALDAAERGCADALIVTGGRTGEPPSLEILKLVKEASRVPVIVGSGMDPQNVGKYLRHCDGVIVGSFIKVGGRAGNPTDPERARRFIEAFREGARAR